LVHRFLERIDTWLKQNHFKTESVMILQNHRTSLYIWKRFYNSPQLAYIKLVLKSVCLKWVCSLMTRLFSFNNENFTLFFYLNNIVPKILNTNLNFWNFKNQDLTLFQQVSLSLNKYGLRGYVLLREPFMNRISLS
jgi:hypothetical protein